MLTISDAGSADFKIIRKIAYDTWPLTYGTILSEIQLEYMLGKFYSEERLLKNMTAKNHLFILVCEDKETLGFASYEYHYDDNPVTHLHKLYMLPAAQGKGAGKLLLAEVEKRAKENHDIAVSLNVNRFNSAYDFYLKNGYEKIGEIDIPIGDGFLMEDFVMEKKL